MLSRMNLIDEAVGVFVDNNGQGIIMIDDFAQLNEKYVEGLFRVLRSPGGTTGGVPNTGVAVSEMAEANLQRIIYYIKTFKRIGCTCTHANVDIYKVRAMYPKRDMEESQKEPEVVPNINTK